MMGQEERLKIKGVFEIPPEGGMHVLTKFQGNPSNKKGDIALGVGGKVGWSMNFCTKFHPVDEWDISQDKFWPADCV